MNTEEIEKVFAQQGQIYLTSGYSTPKVTIDLDEYEMLKQRSVRDEILPFLKVGQKIRIKTSAEEVFGSVCEVDKSDSINHKYRVATPKGSLTIEIKY